MPFFTGVTSGAVSSAVAMSADAAAEAGVPVATGAAGKLRIEPDQVDAALKVFEDAVDKLDIKVRQARSQIRTEATALDRVSRPAAEAFNHASMGGPSTAIAVWTKAVEEMRSIVAQLKAAKETNVNTDNAMAQPFTSATGTMS